MKNSFKKGIYQHYKGYYYEVFGKARHTETLEEIVVYRSLYGDFGFWVRPMEMFLENVEIDGLMVPRFKFIDAQAGQIEYAQEKGNNDDAIGLAIAQGEELKKSLEV